MKRLFLHYLAPQNPTPTDPASITSMAYGKMFLLRPIQLFNLGQNSADKRPSSALTGMPLPGANAKSRNKISPQGLFLE